MAQGCRTKFFSMLKNIRDSEHLYLGNEYAIGLPSASTTAAIDDRMRMSSPGGEDTGEGGQFYANGAHILIRRRNLSHTPHARVPEKIGSSTFIVG